MVGTSVMICPMTRLQRAESYLVSTALMVFWLMVSLSNRNVNFLLDDVCLPRLRFGRPCHLNLGRGRPGLVVE